MGYSLCLTFCSFLTSYQECNKSATSYVMRTQGVQDPYPFPRRFIVSSANEREIGIECSSTFFRRRCESRMSLLNHLVLIYRNPRSSALVPVSTSTKLWDTPTLVAAAGLALTFPCGGRASTPPARKTCTLFDARGV